MTEPTDKCPACVNNIPTTKTKVGENLLLCDKHRSEIDGYLMQVIKDNPDPTLLDSELDRMKHEIYGTRYLLEPDGNMVLLYPDGTKGPIPVLEDEGEIE